MTLKIFLLTSALSFKLFLAFFFSFCIFFLLFCHIRDGSYTVEPLLTTMAGYYLLNVLTQTKRHEAELRFIKPQFSRPLRYRFQEHLSTSKRALQKCGGINCKSKQKDMEEVKRKRLQSYFLFSFMLPFSFLS